LNIQKTTPKEEYPKYKDPHHIIKEESKSQSIKNAEGHSLQKQTN